MRGRPNGLLREEACDAVASNEPWTARLRGHVQG